MAGINTPPVPTQAQWAADWFAADRKHEGKETMDIPKMQSPYLTVAQTKLVFDLPRAVNNFLEVWKPETQTCGAFRYLVCTEHQTGKAFELLNITCPRAVPDFLFEYSQREQA